VVVLTNESVESFRLQLSDADLASLPFAIMPTLKLNHGLVLLDAAFSSQILSAVDQTFLRNILMFGATASDEATGDEDGSAFFKAAALDDSKLVPVLNRAVAYADRYATTSESTYVTQLAAVVLQMMGVEIGAASS
jgi:hypothetical protein